MSSRQAAIKANVAASGFAKPSARAGVLDRKQLFRKFSFYGFAGKSGGFDPHRDLSNLLTLRAHPSRGVRLKGDSDVKGQES